MCLTININVHTNRYPCTENFGHLALRRKPVTFDKDMLVYKRLSHIGYGGIYLTPMRHKLIEFAQGTATQKEEDFGYQQDYYSYADVIEQGIHSSERKFNNAGTIKHYAVIPAGTEFYFGLSQDFVSKKLIIFETQEDYEKYEKTHEVWRNEAVYWYFIGIKNGLSEKEALDRAKNSVW